MGIFGRIDRLFRGSAFLFAPLALIQSEKAVVAGAESNTARPNVLIGEQASENLKEKCYEGM